MSRPTDSLFAVIVVSKYPILLSFARYSQERSLVSFRIRVVDGPNLGQGRRSKSRPRGRGYCAVLSALAEGKVSIPVSLSR